MSAQAEHHAPHPTPKQYVQIALLLGFLTAIEVALYYVEVGFEQVGTEITAPMLIILALVKFFIVVGWYMHLRFEHPLLSKFFTGGAILAFVLYAALLVSLGVIAIGV